MIEVTYSQQAISPSQPSHGQDRMIVVTPELVRWASEALPAVNSYCQSLRNAEYAALAEGQGSWRRGGGPAIAIKADNAGHMSAMLEHLAAGRNTSSHGWLDKEYWERLVRFVEQVLK